MILELAYYGDPILRKKCSPVTEITDEVRQLIQDMIETMRHHDGAGLAAPQVKRDLRIFLTEISQPNPDAKGDDDRWLPAILHTYINPKILSYSEQMWESNEGCLSIPQLYQQVLRPLRIKVEAMDLEGKIFHQELFGPEARAFMHENDHINGVLFIDRLDKKTRQSIEPLLQQIKKKYH